MKSEFDAKLNMDGMLEFIQKTTMTPDEFLKLAYEIQEIKRGKSRDEVNEILPPLIDNEGC